MFGALSVAPAHLPLSPSPKGGGGTQIAPARLAFSTRRHVGECRQHRPNLPLRPWGAERVGVRWGQTFLTPQSPGARFGPRSGPTLLMVDHSPVAGNAPGPWCGARGGALASGSRHDVQEQTGQGGRRPDERVLVACPEFLLRSWPARRYSGRRRRHEGRSLLVRRNPTYPSYPCYPTYPSYPAQSRPKLGDVCPAHRCEVAVRRLRSTTRRSAGR